MVSHLFFFYSLIRNSGICLQCLEFESHVVCNINLLSYIHPFCPNFFKRPLHAARMFCYSSQLFSVDSSEQALEAAKDAGHPCNGTAGAACASREGLRQAKAMCE